MGRLSNFIKKWVSLNLEHNDTKKKFGQMKKGKNRNCSEKKTSIANGEHVDDDHTHATLKTVSTFANSTCTERSLSNTIGKRDLVSNKEEVFRDILGTMTLEQRNSFLIKELGNVPLIENDLVAPVKNIPKKDLKFFKRLGRGSDGTTYLGNMNTKNGENKLVAIKIASTTENGESGWRTEMNTLQSLPSSHPNIIQLYGYSVLKHDSGDHDRAVRCLIFEYCNAGDLSATLRTLTPPSFTLRTALYIARGMAYLHQNDVMHRDLKPENILLHRDTSNSRDYDVKIIDLGLAKRFVSQDEEHSGETGTYRYMAPEVMRHEAYNFKADIYSFGVILWELITRQTPFSNEISQIEAAGKVALLKERPPFPNGTPIVLRDLIGLCWEEDLDLRPSFNEIISILEQIQKSLSEEEKTWLDTPSGHKVY